MISEKKGCQQIRKILNKNQDTPNAEKKLVNELLLPENLTWCQVYLIPHQITTDTNLRWFQYRLINRILATNTFLCKIGIKQNNKCAFCKIDPETLKHIFLECDIVQVFWHELESFVKNSCPHVRDLNITFEDVVLQIHNKQRADKTINFIILCAKWYIYKTKYTSFFPDIQNFRKYLSIQYEAEKFISFTNCKWNNFDKKWMTYKTLLNPD